MQEVQTEKKVKGMKILKEKLRDMEMISRQPNYIQIIKYPKKYKNYNKNMLGRIAPEIQKDLRLEIRMAPRLMDGK